MKKFLFIFLISASICSAQYRDFTNKEGVKVSAKLIEVGPEIAKMEMTNKKVFEVKISDLSPADIDYIKNWSMWKFTIEVKEDVDLQPKIPESARTEEKMAGYFIVINAIRTDKNGWRPYDITRIRGDKFQILKKELESAPTILEKAGKEHGKGFKVEFRKEMLGSRHYTPSWSVSWDKEENSPRFYLGQTYDVKGLDIDEVWRLIDFLKPYDAVKEVEKIERFKQSVKK